jgi:hypothetical protein
VPDWAGRAAELDEMSLRAAIYATRLPGDSRTSRLPPCLAPVRDLVDSVGRESLAANVEAITMVVRCVEDFAVNSGTH